MIVYGPSASPFVRKVLAYAHEKGIAIERKMASPTEPRDADFAAASPYGKIPAFKDGDFLISDSSAIIASLEAKHPQPVLIPAEPKARARVVWFDEFADTLLASAVQPIFFNRVVAKLLVRPADLAAADRVEKEELPKHYRYLESVLPPSGFLVGDKLTLADISVATMLANLDHLGIGPKAADYPKAAKFAATMLARPSFKGFIEAERKMLAAAA
jgi:glutathione S-transferase